MQCWVDSQKLQAFPFCMRATPEQIDWNHVLERINKSHNRRQRLHEMSDTMDRMREARDLDGKAKDLKNVFHFASRKDFERVADSDTAKAVRQLSNDVHTLFANMFFNETGRVLAEYRAKNYLDLVRIICALRVFEFEHRRTPHAIEELSESLVKTLRDPFSNQPYRFENDGEKVTIYSVSMNQLDDGGRVDDDIEGDRGFVIYPRH